MDWLSQHHSLRFGLFLFTWTTGIGLLVSDYFFGTGLLGVALICLSRLFGARAPVWEKWAGVAVFLLLSTLFLRFPLDAGDSSYPSRHKWDFAFWPFLGLLQIWREYRYFRPEPKAAAALKE